MIIAPRWLTEAYEPLLALVPGELLEPVEVFCDMHFPAPRCWVLRLQEVTTPYGWRWSTIIA